MLSTWVTISQGLEDVEGAELQGRVIDGGGIEITHQLGGRLLECPDAGEKRLFGEPFVVAALSATGEVNGIEGFGLRTEIF